MFGPNLNTSCLPKPKMLLGAQQYADSVDKKDQGLRWVLAKCRLRKRLIFFFIRIILNFLEERFRRIERKHNNHLGKGNQAEEHKRDFL